MKLSSGDWKRLKSRPLLSGPVSAEHALTVSHLSKDFSGLKAVDDLSFQVKRGEIYGFLGPNGAGKTTTIKMMLGLTYPNGGQVTIDGLDLSENPHEIKRRIGFLPERVAFYSNLTAMQTMEFYADLKGQPKDKLGTLLEGVGLQNFADKKVGTYSKGMVQLLGVAQVMIGDPKILILDEPTSGLDPNWTRVVKDRVRAANENGATVFFSSHILSEVQELAHKVAILSKGKLVAEDTVDNLGAELHIKPRLILTIDGPHEAAAKALAGLEGIEGSFSQGNDFVVVCEPATKMKVLTRLEENQVKVTNFKTVEPSLEEVFLKYTEDVKGSIR